MQFTDRLLLDQSEVVCSARLLLGSGLALWRPLDVTAEDIDCEPLVKDILFSMLDSAAVDETVEH